jgi:hypothetical protein
MTGGEYGGAQQAPFDASHMDIGLILLEKGAATKVPDGKYGSPLQKPCGCCSSIVSVSTREFPLSA